MKPTIGPDFAGPAYDRSMDHQRLSGQLLRVHDAMSDHQWRTVQEIAHLTGDPGPSILAQLGHLRKQRFGAYPVNKRIRGRREDGLYEYQVGEKGEGVPQRNPLAVRAERAEALVEELRHRVVELEHALDKYAQV